MKISFKNPPVEEVVLGIQFDKLQKFCGIHPGLFYKVLKDRYPNYEMRPPLPRTYEKFDQQEPYPQEIAVAQIPPLPRNWYLNTNSTRLVQLQDEHFIYNWRKVSGNEDYPRYHIIKKDYLVLWEEFISFAKRNEYELGEINPNHWEVTYVNFIHKGSLWDNNTDLSKIFHCWPEKTKDVYLPEQEHLNISIVYSFPEKTGRLYVSLQPVLRRLKDKDIESFQLKLTAKGRFKVDDGIEQALDRGHEWIVRGFVDLTSEFAQKKWARER